MADEAKRYPPSERKRARLWQAGSTPASPALVAVAVVTTAAALVAFGGPVAFAWMSAWVRASLEAAGEPAHALAAAECVARNAALLIGGTSLVIVATALAVQAAQAGGHGDAAPSAPASRDASFTLTFDGWRLGRAALVVAVATVAVAAAVRGALSDAAGVFDVTTPMDVFDEVGRSVAGPLLIVLIAVAALDAICGRTAWARGAWMTRREVEEEMRETAGHPLTRQRRSVLSRRRNDA